MDLGLTDCVIAVAGSSRGIGYAIAEAALAEGARVSISGRDRDRLQLAAAELTAAHGESRVHAVQCDLALDDGAKQFVDSTKDALGGIDAVVANAGTGAFRPGWDAPTDDWQQAFAANVWPAQRVLTHALRELVAAKKGSAVVIASIAGLEGSASPIAYSAAKAALIAYSKNLARSLAKDGVRVNCVAPGNVLFGGGRWEARLAEDRESVEAYIESEVPLKRFGTADEIAAAVMFLVSERASFITGSCLVVDGGQTRGFH